jgi:hypothetical protein
MPLIAYTKYTLGHVYRTFIFKVLGGGLLCALAPALAVQEDGVVRGLGVAADQHVMSGGYKPRGRSRDGVRGICNMYTCLG